MIYPSLLANLWKLDPVTKEVKALLVTRKYTPSPKHATTRDIDGEVVGPGYKAGGLVLTGKTWTDGVFRAADLLWPEATITDAARVVVYQGDILLCCVDLPQIGNCTNGPFKVTWDSQGIFSLNLQGI